MSQEIFEHLVQCTKCWALMMVLRERAASEPEEGRLRHIEASLVQRLTPVRPLPSFDVLLLTAAAMFVLIVIVDAMPFSMNGWSALTIAQRVAIFTSVGASAVLLAAFIVKQMAPGSKYLLAPVRLLIAVFCGLGIVIAAMFQPSAESAFLTNGSMCLRNGLACSIPAILLFGLFVRRGAMLFPKLIGVTAGGLSGLVGLSVLEINCSNLNLFHILVWHFGVVLISCGAGALLGLAVERLARMRTRSGS